MLLQTLRWMFLFSFLFFRYTPRSIIAGWYSSPTCRFLRHLMLFSTVVAPIYISTNCVFISLFTSSSPTFVICDLFDDSHSGKCEVISHCCFNCHFYDWINNVENLFMFLWVTFMSSMEKHTCGSSGFCFVFFVVVFVFCFLFFFFWLFRAEFTAHTSSQARVKSELKLPAYTRATAMRDPSHVCHLHHSSQQCWILKPLTKARDRNCALTDTSQFWYHWAAMGTPSAHFLNRLFFVFFFFFFPCWVVWAIYIYWIVTSYQLYYLHIFSPI